MRYGSVILVVYVIFIKISNIPIIMSKVIIVTLMRVVLLGMITLAVVNLLRIVGPVTIVLAAVNLLRIVGPVTIVLPLTII